MRSILRLLASFPLLATTLHGAPLPGQPSSESAPGAGETDDAAAARALARLAAEDVVWSSPGGDAAGSVPLGNGALGVNAWIEPGGDLVLLLSHTDAFSEADRLLKLGRVRVSLDPPLDVARFSQRVRATEGRMSVEAGDARVEVWVDATSPVVWATVEGTTPRAATARLERWRTAERRLEGAELASSWTMRDAPPAVEVRESADVVVAPDAEPDAVVWYHRNEWSVVPFTLEHQGLAEESGAFGDPLILRTFGGWLGGEGFARDAVDAEAMRAMPATRHALRVAASCVQADDVDGWIERLGDVAATNADADASRARTAAWWRARFASSWVIAEPRATPSSILDNDHPLRAGFDSNGANRWQGSIARVRIHEDMLGAREIAALHAAGAAGGDGGTTVATSAGESWRLMRGFSRDGSFTVDAWATPAVDGLTARIADKMAAGGSDGFLLDLQGGRLRAIVGDATVQSDAVLAAGRASHVALSFVASDREIALWVDGVEVARGNGRPARPRPSLVQAYAAQRAVALAATGGRFPVKFNGSIFTVAPRPVNGLPFDDDYRRWGGCYWWQNTRLAYHGLLARGDGDRMASLLDFYAGTVDGARARARAWHGVDGAWFPETMTTFGSHGNGDYGWNREGVDRAVVQCPWWQWAWNQGPELVALMLDHWDHTGDAARLGKSTIPVANAVLAWFDGRFARDGDGRLVLSPTQSLETYWTGVVNDLPTVAGLREITARLCALPDGFGTPEERAFWRRMREACPPLPRTADGARLAPAERFDPRRSNCENPELVAVWPFRLAREDLAVGRATFAARVERMTHGWTQDGMQAARLGLADEAAANVLAKLGNTHPAFRHPTFWGPNFDWVPDQCHGSNLLATVEEMLLGRDGDRIVVLPAWPRDWDASFRLHAPGRTVVTGEVRDGRLVALEVEPASRRAEVVAGEGWAIPDATR
ncbi:MAG: hypothetical protein RIS86_2230 [Planctomycetota bacterium]